MMIKSLTMFTVVCDICGCDNGQNSDIAAWSDEDSARFDAEECGFKRIDGKDVCSGCWTYNDDDELVIWKEAVMKKILIVDDKGCENLYVVGTGNFDGEKTLSFQELQLPSKEWIDDAIHWITLNRSIREEFPKRIVDFLVQLKGGE